MVHHQTFRFLIQKFLTLFEGEKTLFQDDRPRVNRLSVVRSKGQKSSDLYFGLV